MSNYPVRPHMFRPMDVAVVNDVATLTYDGKYVPVVFATPRRAVAELQKAYKIKNQEVIPLPYISVQRLAPVLDQLRYARGFHRGVYLSDNGKSSLVIKRGTPYTVDYQINVWDKKRYRLQEIVEQYLSRYWPMHRLLVDYGPPYDAIGCHVSIMTIEDLSELEPGEDADRMLRHNIQISIEGWAFEDAVWVPTVDEVIVCIKENDESGDLLEDITYSRNQLCGG